MKCGFVAIVGEPNAGKSTLLNRWVGEHVAIVSPKAQTTRQAIRGILNRPDAQVIFVDTPGYHQSDKAFNQYMIDKVKETIKDADVCCLVTDPVTELSPLNLELAAYAQSKRKPTIVVTNKIDTLKTGPATGHAISALNGDGCDALLEELIKLLPEGPALFPDDIYTECSSRFLVGELIREVLLEKMHQEIPYAAAVVIDEYTEKPTITVIKAAIVIEKDSQKSMVIGAGGTMIKDIGTEARKRIEKLVDQKVFLELFVRVEKNWTKDPKKVEEMGYE